jgi:hypothetical protein
MNNLPHKHSIIVLLIVSVFTFVCGAAARSYFQDGGPVWLDGVVGIMGGLTVWLWALVNGLIVYDIWHTSARRRIYSIIVGIVFSIVGIIIGVSAFASGLARMVNSIR